MTAKQTEQLHSQAEGIDARPLIEAAAILAEGQIAAASATMAALPAICSAAEAMAATIRSGNCLYYIAAGSSGLMAAADAQELGGTFSVPATQIRILMAGGLPTGPEMPGATEDDTASLAKDLAELTPGDTVIGVSASGTTPFTVEAVQTARAAGATVVGIANNADCALLTLSDHAICLATPPEVLSGSTRMGAGTAQKIALNMMSTLMAMELGHIHDGMMVNLRADNIKLRNRAERIVARVANVTTSAAAEALETSGGDVKGAILVAAGAPSTEAARHLLRDTGGHIRPALSSLHSN